MQIYQFLYIHDEFSHTKGEEKDKFENLYTVNWLFSTI